MVARQQLLFWLTFLLCAWSNFQVLMTPSFDPVEDGRKLIRFGPLSTVSRGNLGHVLIWVFIYDVPLDDVEAA